MRWSRPIAASTLLILLALHAAARDARDCDALSGIPIAARAKVSAVLAQDLPEYQVHQTSMGFTAHDLRQELTLRFDSRGVETDRRGLRSDLALHGFGRGDALTTAEHVAPRLVDHQVEYRRRGLTESYLNGPLGLQQRFLFAGKPVGRRDLPVSIALAVSGDLRGAIETEGTRRYGDFAATDATGRQFAATLELRDQMLLVRVSDVGARYPLVIEALVQLAELTPSDGLPLGQLGMSVATTAGTIVAGSPGATVGSNQRQGAVYVFVKPKSGWINMTQTAKLTASDGAALDELGSSVGIDGDTIVAGKQLYSNFVVSAAYVFVRPSRGWKNRVETARLEPFPLGQTAGFSVAISGDTIVVGAPFLRAVAAYIFVKPAGGWHTTSVFAARLTNSHKSTFEEFAFSVSINGDTVVVGAPAAMVGPNSEQGAAYVFVEPPGGWKDMNQTAKLTVSDGAQGDFFGTAVSVSGDTIVGGAPFAPFVDNTTGPGRAYIFVKPTGGWINTTETARLTASDGISGDLFGNAVYVNGSEAVIGAPYKTIGSNRSQGMAYLFVRPSGGWANANETAEVTASDGTQWEGFGASVATLGNFLVIGGPSINVGDNVDPTAGAAYLFAPDGKAIPRELHANLK